MDQHFSLEGYVVKYQTIDFPQLLLCGLLQNPQNLRDQFFLTHTTVPLFRTIVTYNIILNFYSVKSCYKNFVDSKIKYAASWDMTLPAAKIHTLHTSSNK